MPKVHIETGDDRRTNVRSATDALGDAFVDKLNNASLILVKPDVGHHELQLAATHVDALRGVLDVIRQHTMAPIVVGDASHFGTRAGFRTFGYEHLCNEYDRVMLNDLNDDAYVDETIEREDGTRMPVRRSKIARDADVTIALANMKTHADFGTELAVKTWALGTWIVPPRLGAEGMVWSRAPWLYESGARAMHAVVAALYGALSPAFTVVDGMLAMEGDGSVFGSAVPMNVALAGEDAVAVDAVAATLMGIDPHAIGYLEMCRERGYGENDMARIEAPPLLVSQLMRTFALPESTKNHMTDWQT